MSKRRVFIYNYKYIEINPHLQNNQWRKEQVMQYRNFGTTGVKVSALGYGCMRLPLLDSKNGKSIDEKEAISMIRSAIDAGLNYVDTAYPYHDGESEILVGKALQDGYREKVYLATKLPMWLVHQTEDFDRYLDEQLEKLDTDHIDMYMLHAMDKGRYQDMCTYRLTEKLNEAKAAGKIRYAGFSFHDDAETFRTIIDSYNWDFCQIQMNYIDVNNQATLKGMEYAASKGIAVIIMEPLLGGKLANPPKQVAKVLSEDKTPVEWALDFLWNRPEVSLILSGMSSMPQTMDNLLYADRSSVGMLSAEELEMFARAKEIYDTKAIVPCTKCRYCMPCPFGLDIPELFESYNRTATQGMKEAYAMYSAMEKKADACRKCHHCEKECPQHIRISEVMEELAGVFADM